MKTAGLLGFSAVKGNTLDCRPETDRMSPKTLLCLLLLFFLAASATAQEAAGDAEDEAAVAVEEPAAEEGEDAPDEIDDSDLDEQTYEVDDDDFVPTEEIPADEPIPFPSNI